MQYTYCRSIYSFEQNKWFEQKDGPRQWAIWAVLGPRRANNFTAQGRWWPQGLPQNGKFRQVLQGFLQPVPSNGQG